MKKIAIPALLLTFSMNVFSANQDNYRVTFDFLDFNNLTTGSGSGGSGSEEFATEGQTYSSSLSTYNSGDPLSSDDSGWIVQNYQNEEKTDFNIILNGQNLYSESINIGNLSTMNKEEQVTVSYDGSHYVLTRGNLVDSGTLSGDRSYKSYDVTVSSITENSDPVQAMSFEPIPLNGCKGYNVGSGGSKLVSVYYDKDGDEPYTYTARARYSEEYSDGTFQEFKEIGHEGYGITDSRGANSFTTSLTTWNNVNIENHIYTISRGSTVRNSRDNSLESWYYYDICFNQTGTLW